MASSAYCFFHSRWASEVVEFWREERRQFSQSSQFTLNRRVVQCGFPSHSLSRRVIYKLRRRFIRISQTDRKYAVISVAHFSGAFQWYRTGAVIPFCWYKLRKLFRFTRIVAQPCHPGKVKILSVVYLLPSSCVWMYVHTLLRVRRTIVTNGNVQDLISVSFMGI